MATGYWVSQAVRAMAVLSLADHLASGPRTAADLAEATGAHAPSLARLLRALVALGLCGREVSGRFRLTPLGETLRSDVPDSAVLRAVFHGALVRAGLGGAAPRRAHGRANLPPRPRRQLLGLPGRAPGGRGALRRRHERGRLRPCRGPPRREGTLKHRHGSRCRRRAGPAPGWALVGYSRPAWRPL